MKNLLTLLFCIALSFSFAQKVTKRSITASQIDAVFSQWDTKNTPGIAVGILNDGKIVHAKGYGLANLEHQISITPKTKFHIGDIAKEFTVYALLLLEQRGQLSLQDDIRKYMPKKLFLDNAISIQQLIHHTGGLNNHEVVKALSGWRQEDIFTKEQAYEMIRNQSKSTVNDQRHSDLGFMILEDLIAQISAMSYVDFVSKEIFEPLGMTHSIFDTKGDIITNKAHGYFSNQDGFVNTTMNHKQTLLSDVYTTVEDMCLWAKELENPTIGTKALVTKFDDLSIVNGEKVKEANTALYTGGHRYWNYRGAKKLTHIEVAGGYASKLIRYPEYNLAIVVLGNDGAYNGYAATGASALYLEDFLDTRSNATATPEIASEKMSKKHLARFEGTYWDSNNHASRKIHIANDTLRYFRSPGNESALVPITKNSFKMITGAEVVVRFDTKTSPKTMSVKVGDDMFYSIAYDVNASWANDLSLFTGNYYAAALNTSYDLRATNGKLILTHQRLQPVQLEPRIPDVFSGNRSHFSSLFFKRDANGVIKGFQLSTRGVQDIWFQKEQTQDKNIQKTQ